MFLWRKGMEAKYLLSRTVRNVQATREKKRMKQFVMLLKGSLIGVLRGSMTFYREELAESEGSPRVWN